MERNQRLPTGLMWEHGIRVVEHEFLDWVETTGYEFQQDTQELTWSEGGHSAWVKYLGEEHRYIGLTTVIVLTLDHELEPKLKELNEQLPPELRFNPLR